MPVMLNAMILDIVLDIHLFVMDPVLVDMVMMSRTAVSTE